MTDPIDLLERLDTGRTPPAVEHVRRRGTQIRRRRTTTLTVAAAAAVAVVATGSVAALGRPDAGTLPVTTPSSSPSALPTPPPTSATPTPPPTRPSAYPTPPARDVLGPDGYRDLRLGMTVQQAKATGDLTLVDVPKGGLAGGCAGFRFQGQSPAGGVDAGVDGYLSARHGLVAIFARPGMSTPEGIRLGSTWARVHRAYPDGRFNADHYWIVPTGPGTAYEFGIDDTQKVREMLVMRTDQDCFG